MVCGSHKREIAVRVCEHVLVATLIFFIFKDLLLKKVIIVLNVCLKISLSGIRKDWVHGAGVTLRSLRCRVCTVRLVRVLPT